MFELKSISDDGVPPALEKAHRYRLLNEPMEAESICLDVLEVAPDNQQALATLVLALTDQFHKKLAHGFQRARETAARLQSEYEREYYAGIICERRAKTHFDHAHPGYGEHAYDWFRQAMGHYETAERLSPEGNDDAILRWNTCARIIDRHPEILPPQHAPSHPIQLE